MSDTLAINGSDTSSQLRTIAEASSGTAASNELGKDEFLKILVAQMANQDPLDPASNTEFIAQLAQFSALEQMQNINASMNTLLANNMIGKDVCIQPENSDELIYGKVEGVVTDGGINYLLVDGEYYAMDQVIAVFAPEEESAGQQLPMQASLLGMIATATVTSDDGTQRTISGEITRLFTQDNQMYAVIGDVSVLVSAITGLSAKTETAEAETE
jgi:flagellar basal-body rod modification protein FlgD